MGRILAVRQDIKNLSHSRLHLLNCPYLAGKQWAFVEREQFPEPPHLIGGKALHFLAEELLNKTWVQNKTLARDDADKFVKRAENHLWSSLNGFSAPSSFNPQDKRDVLWMSEEERAEKSPQQMEKHIKTEIAKYKNRHLPAMRALAEMCTMPSPFLSTQTEIRFSITLQSPRSPLIHIPIQGVIDVKHAVRPSKAYSRGGSIIRDWKSGSFSYFGQDGLEGNEQMLIYWPAVKEADGEFPLAGYFHSLNIPAAVVHKYGAKALENNQYRAQAVIRYDEHFPELLRLYDDVWAVLNFLAQPALCEEDVWERKEWFPSSVAGTKAGLKELVTQNRLIPKIGKWCNRCPARSDCRENNPEDWEQFGHQEALGNVTSNIIPFPEDDWLELGNEDELVQILPKPDPPKGPQQLSLYNTPVTTSPYKPFRKKRVEVEAQGLYADKRVLAMLHQMKSNLPVVTGVMCPCSKSKLNNIFLLMAIGEFYAEREENAETQRAMGRTPSGVGELKMRKLYNSQAVRDILKNCPVENCPHSKKNTQIPQAS